MPRKPDPQIRTRALSTVLSVLFIVPSPCNCAALDNQGPFRALCKAWVAAKTVRLNAWQRPEQSQEYYDIQNYNMSVATTEWQSIFKLKDADKDWATFKESNKPTFDKVDWTEYWEDWRPAHAAVFGKSATWIKENPLKLQQHQLAAARDYLNRTAHDARSLYQQIAIEPSDGQKPLATVIEETLQDTLCSGTLKLNGDKSGCTDNALAAIQKTDECTGAKAGQSIGHDLMRLCSTQTADPCTPGNEATVIMDAGTLENGVLAALTKHCGQPAEDAGAVDMLTSALYATEAQISNAAAATNKVTIGKTANANECSASQADCVDYTNYFGENNKDFDSIPWVTKFRKAIKLLKQNDAHKQITDNMQRQIAALRRSSSRKYNAKDAAPIAAASVDQQGIHKNKHKADIECDKHHDNQTECEKLECTYDANAADAKKCKPKTGTENPATGTGDGAAPKEGPATTGCAKYGTKAECDADKTGDKQNCAWRKGKDNKDDKG